MIVQGPEVRQWDCNICPESGKISYGGLPLLLTREIVSHQPHYH